MAGCSNHTCLSPLSKDNRVIVEQKLHRLLYLESKINGLWKLTVRLPSKLLED